MASPTKAQVLAVLLLLAGATRGTAAGGALCPNNTASSGYCNSQPCTSNLCVCGSGYNGSSCETDPTGTIATGGAYCFGSAYCNGQTCLFTQCSCSSGYTGANCEIDLATGTISSGGAACYPPIGSANCNGQTCTSSNFQCSCSSGYTGANCEIGVSPSPASPSPSQSSSPSPASSPSSIASTSSPSPSSPLKSDAPPSSSGSQLYYLGFLGLLAAVFIAIGVAVCCFWESIVARWYPSPEPMYSPSLQPSVVAYLQPSAGYYPPPPPPTPMAP